MPPTILFKPLEAKLTRNTEYLGKMSPYCTFIVGRQKIKGKPCKKGGKTPIWTDSILIPFDDHPTCLVQIKHKDLIKDCKIGSFEIDLYQIEAEGNSKKWYTLFHNERPTGEILIETIYYPKSATQSMTNLSTPSRSSLTNSRSSQDDSTNSNQSGLSNNFSLIQTQLRRAGSAEISGNVLSPIQESSSGPRRDEEYAQEALMRGVGAIQGFDHTHYGRSLSFP